MSKKFLVFNSKDRNRVQMKQTFSLDSLDSLNSPDSPDSMNSMNSTNSPKRWWRVTKRILVALILIAVILIYGVLPYLLARVVTNASTRPTDRQLTTTPATYG